MHVDIRILQITYMQKRNDAWNLISHFMIMTNNVTQYTDRILKIVMNITANEVMPKFHRVQNNSNLYESSNV